MIHLLFSKKTSVVVIKVRSLEKLSSQQTEIKKKNMTIILKAMSGNQGLATRGFKIRKVLK